MSPIRRGMIVAGMLVGISAFGAGAWAQIAVDTMKLNLVPPDSVYVKRDGGRIVVGWYPPAGAAASVSGSRDFTNWYKSTPTTPAISHVEISGLYSGTVDRTLKIGKVVLGNVSVDTIGPGGEAVLKLYAEVRDRNDSYYKEFNVGYPSYTPGTPVPMTLVGQQTGDTLKLGISLAFGAGLVDTTALGGPPFFEIDLQTYEGFHVWRGLAPAPSRMVVVEELSREDAFVGIEADSIYFREWPKKDALGRPYFEFVDTDVYVGFTYYYFVSCFDRGYFKGKTLFNKRDNVICDEADPATCEAAAVRITMTVDAGPTNGMGRIYAVPNPYRTGTSAATSPYYHNFPDMSIKFFNVPKEADLRVFTVSGELVWDTHHSSPSGENGVVSWDVKNNHDQEIGSGVYIYRVEASDGSQMYGRIVVIR